MFTKSKLMISNVVFVPIHTTCWINVSINTIGEASKAL